MIVFFYFPNSIKKTNFVDYFSSRLSKLQFTCQEEQFIGKYFSQIFVCHFCTMSDFFVPFLEKFLRGCLNCILRVRSFLKKNRFWTFSDFFYRPSKKLRRCCQNCFLCVHRNVLRNNVVFENMSFYLITSEHWVEKSWLSVGKFTAEISKLLSTCWY